MSCIIGFKTAGGDSVDLEKPSATAACPIDQIKCFIFFLFIILSSIPIVEVAGIGGQKMQENNRYMARLRVIIIVS